MTTLVTGGAGYIGSHMVLALNDAGENVVVLDDLSTGRAWLLPENVTLVEGDVGDGALVEEVLQKNNVEAVVHFAGSIVVPESVSNPLRYFQNNTCKSRQLIELCVTSDVRNFVFSSTAAVYGETTLSPIAEEAPLAPISPYGASKLMTERMLHDTSVAHGLRYIALRYFNVAGADPWGRSGQASPNATHLIKVASQAAVGERSHMSIYGSDYDTPDGTGVRDYIHVNDLIKAHVLALEHLAAGGASNVMNCGYGKGASVREVIDTVKRVSGVDFEVREAPRREGDAATLVAKADRVRDYLGWTPRYDDLDTIVETALSWEKRLRNRK